MGGRKPYQVRQSPRWYLGNRFFKRYMLRELTSVPVALAALNLFWGLAALAGSAEAWGGWMAAQRHPVLLLLNILAIAAALFNSKTWFEAVPKAMPIRRGEHFVPARVLIRASWAAMGAVLVLLLLAVVWLA